MNMVVLTDGNKLYPRLIMEHLPIMMLYHQLKFEMVVLSRPINIITKETYWKRSQMIKLVWNIIMMKYQVFHAVAYVSLP